MGMGADVSTAIISAAHTRRRGSPGCAQHSVPRQPFWRQISAPLRTAFDAIFHSDQFWPGRDARRRDRVGSGWSRPPLSARRIKLGQSPPGLCDRYPHRIGSIPGYL